MICLFFPSYCSEHFWRRRKPLKINKKSIFYSSDRASSCKPQKGGTSGSSSICSSTSSTKPTHHRKRKKHHVKRSKSRSQTITQPTEIPEQIPITSALDIRSNSSGDDDEEEEIVEDEEVERIRQQLADVNCQDLCDDSDSLDEALDAELLDDDPDATFLSSTTLPNIQ